MTDKEKVVQWMIDQGYSTGHGDTIEDLLEELESQVMERGREVCAEIVSAGTNEPVQTETLKILRAERYRLASLILGKD